MSMNPEPEKFQDLCRLLALKRYEQPPPGYFDKFSRQVIVRIRAGETGQDPSFLEKLTVEVRWLQRLWNGMEEKPVWAGAFGVAVCGVLFAGILYSERLDNSASTPFSLAGGPPPGLQERVTPVSAVMGQFDRVDFSSTGGMAPADMRRSLFQEVRESQPWATPVPATYNSLQPN